MVRLHADQLAVGMGHQLAEAVDSFRSQWRNCQRKLTEKPSAELESLVHHVGEHVGGRVVAPMGHLLEVAPVHVVIEEVRRHVLWLGARGDDLRGESDASWLMGHAVGDQVLGHSKRPFRWEAPVLEP